MTKLTYNVLANGEGFDVGRLIAHVERMKEPPGWIQFMNNVGAAATFKRRFPNINVIYRGWPDDDAPRSHGYKDWLDNRIAAIGENDFWLYLNNESGSGDDVLNWSTNSMLLNTRPGYGRKLLVGGFSNGTPKENRWYEPAARRFLDMCNDTRNNTVLHLHEYAGGHMMSSYTRNPDMATWPQNITDLELYHVGRYRFLIRACQQMQIAVPRLGITEFGFDDTYDIKPWLETLIKTPGYYNIRGWRTLREQWREWWSAKTTIQAYFANIDYAMRVIYPDPLIEFVSIFSMWDSGGWDQFRVDNEPEFLKTREEYRTMALPPLPLNNPANGKNKVRFVTGSGEDNPTYGPVNARATAGGTILGNAKVNHGDEITVHPEREYKGDYWWCHATVDGVDCWFALVGAIRFTPVAEPVPQTAAVALDDVRKWITWLIKGNEELTAQISQNTAMIAALQKLLPS